MFPRIGQTRQALDALARSGALGRVRYLHLATHGTMHPQLPLQSALILARDRLPDPAAQVEKGLPVYDGRLTAAEVMRDWRLAKSWLHRRLSEERPDDA